jgi:hypothetical protein
MTEAEYNLFTDYNQFVVFDSSRANWGNDLWTDQELEAMFIQGDGYITVGTRRRFSAPVTVRVLEGDAPAVKADKTQRGTLSIPSGVLEVSGVSDNGLSGGKLTVEPGEYSVRVDYLNLDSVDEDEIEGDDRYIVTLQPLTPDSAAG